jgi:basic membrane protein A
VNRPESIASVRPASILYGVRGDPHDDGWCAAAHFAVDTVRRETGCRIEIVETLPDSVGDEWSAVVGHGIEFAAAIVELAAATPDVSFLLTDYLGPEICSARPNLGCVDWQWDEGAFLAGVLASHLSTSGKVGVLGGTACRTQYLAMAGFVRGASLDGRDVEVLTALAGSFGDPERGFHFANAFFDAGVDVLLHTADSTGRGAIKAATERARTMIGFLNNDDRDHTCVAAVISTDVEGLVASLFGRLARGERPVGITDAGLASGRQRFDLTGTVPEGIRRRIDEVIEGLSDGSLQAREP